MNLPSKRVMVLCVFVIAAPWSSLASACTDPTRDDIACYAEEFAAADRKLNETYKALMDVLKTDGKTEEIRDLRLHQRAWLKNMTKQCEAEATEEFTDGPYRSLVLVGCKLKRTRDRIGDLDTMLERAKN